MDPFQEKERIAKAMANLIVELELLGYSGTATLASKGGKVIWVKRRKRNRTKKEAPSE